LQTIFPCVSANLALTTYSCKKSNSKISKNIQNNRLQSARTSQQKTITWGSRL